MYYGVKYLILLWYYSVRELKMKSIVSDNQYKFAQKKQKNIFFYQSLIIPFIKIGAGTSFFLETIFVRGGVLIWFINHSEKSVTNCL